MIRSTTPVPLLTPVRVRPLETRIVPAVCVCVVNDFVFVTGLTRDFTRDSSLLPGLNGSQWDSQIPRVPTRQSFLQGPVSGVTKRRTGTGWGVLRRTASLQDPPKNRCSSKYGLSTSTLTRDTCRKDSHAYRNASAKSQAKCYVESSVLRCLCSPCRHALL